MAHQLHAFTKKHPSTTHIFGLSSSSPKLKTLIQAYIVRALAYAKTLAIELINSKNDVERYVIELKRKTKKKKMKNTTTTTSLLAITMCFSRSSSHVRPMPESSSTYDHDDDDDHLHINAYYDSSWNTPIDATTSKLGDEDGMDETRVLSGYLQWLEEKEEGDGGDGGSEIDRLAEMFIERCHEKFRLEKQESYRRYQEMLARSI